MTDATRTAAGPTVLLAGALLRAYGRLRRCPAR